MKALVYKGKQNIVLDNVNIPELNEGEALVKVAYAGICGSDVTVYEGKNPRVPMGTIIGHELSGEIVEVKGGNCSLKIGDKVTLEPIIACGKCFFCRTGDYHACQNFKLLGIYTHGGFAEYVKAPVEKIYKLPGNVPLQSGALIEPLSVAVHAVKQSSLKYGDNAVIIGGGPIGLLVAHVARAAGANVLVSDINDYRLELAKKAGFDTNDGKIYNLENIVHEKYGQIGADIVFECAGVQPAIEESLNICRSKGQIIIVAAHKDPRSIDLFKIHLKEISIRGIKVYNFRDYQAAIGLMSNGSIDSQLFISHIIKLENFVEGIELMRGGKNAMKILIDLTGSEDKA